MIENFLKYPHLPILLLSWLIAVFTIPLIMRMSPLIGALDLPGSESHKAHRNPVSFLGGVAIFIAFAVATIYPKDFQAVHDYPDVWTYITNGEHRKLFGIVLSGTLVWILGLVDDFKHLNAILKLVVIFGVTVMLDFFGVTLNIFGYDWLNILMTVFWIAGVTSATNSLDHVDGATAGTTAISAFFVLLFAWYSVPPQNWLSYCAVALLGAVLGFLLFNFNPARIYLGDNGAFFCGYVMAAMSLLGGWSEDPVKALLVPPLLMITPIYDIVMSTVLRYKNGIVRSFPEAILYCGKDHSTHRMQAHGLSKSVSVYVLYGISAMGGLVALTSQFLGTPGFVAVTSMFLFGLVLFTKWLDECPPSKLGYPKRD